MSNKRFTFGKHKDLLVSDVAVTNPGYIVWFFENVEDPERFVTEAQYQEAQQDMGEIEDLYRELDGMSPGPEWWKD